MKKLAKIIIPVLIIVLFVAYAVHWAFFDIQRLDGQKLLKESSSPDGKYTVSVYLNNGGATTGYAVLCSVKDNESGKERNIYWKYRIENANVEWTNEKTVIINGVELDVTKDSYDYRHD